MRTVDLAQILIRSARTGNSGAKFCPDEPIAGCQQRAYDPAQHGLRAAHGADYQRNGDERAYADHVDHVQRCGAPQANAADQLGLRSLVVCLCHSIVELTKLCDCRICKTQQVEAELV